MTTWYKKKTPNGIYYSPFTTAKPTYHYIGNGDKHPTPKELVEFLTKNSDSQDMYVDSSGYITMYSADEGKLEKITVPEGLYLYKRSDPDSPERLLPLSVRKEAYVDVEDLTNEIKKDIDDFLNSEDIYRDPTLPMMYKLGLLMYGDPGNGKSSLLRQLLEHKFPAGTITIFLYSMPSVDFLEKIKETLSDRLKIFVFEEFVTVVENMPLHVVLNFLDGEHSVDRSITIATTNYPEKLPANLVDRPSRFDKRYKIGNPKAKDRKKLLEFYLKRRVLDDEVGLTKDLSVAALKEVALLVRVKKMDFQTAVKHMKDFSELVKNDFGEMKKIGIRDWSDD